MNKNPPFKKELSVQWIKAASGNTYPCLLAALKNIDKSSEEQLKMICLDESKNFQND